MGIDLYNNRPELFKHKYILTRDDLGIILKYKFGPKHGCRLAQQDWPESSKHKYILTRDDLRIILRYKLGPNHGSDND